VSKPIGYGYDKISGIDLTIKPNIKEIRNPFLSLKLTVSVCSQRTLIILGIFDNRIIEFLRDRDSNTSAFWCFRPFLWFS